MYVTTDPRGNKEPKTQNVTNTRNKITNLIYCKWMTSDTTLPLCPLQPSNPHLWQLTLLILLSPPPPHSPRQGQGAVVQVLAGPLLLPLSHSEGQGFLSGDRCAYQTPALNPAPRGSHNYLRARLPRLSSNNALKPFSKEPVC